MTILSVANLRTLIDVSNHKSDLVIENTIEDVEANFVKRYYQDRVFIHLLENVGQSNTFVDLILNGGTYFDTSDTPKKYYLNGLNKAISLLTYCDLMVKQTVITRYGAVNKADSYSVKPDFDNVLEQINRYRSTALAYLKDIDFMLIYCDSSAYTSSDITIIEEYRTDNDNKIKEFLAY